MPALKQRHASRRSVRPALPATRTQHRILCVDDDDDLTRIIKARLQRASVEVSRAASGKEGLKLAHSHRPDAVITDLSMAHGDGEFLLRRLKSRSSTATIPVIVISGIADSKRIAEIEQYGAAAVLRKPIAFDDLFTQLQAHLDGLQPFGLTEGNHESPQRILNGRSLRFDCASTAVGPIFPMN